MKWYAYKNMVRRSVDLLLVDESKGRTWIGDPLTVTMTEQTDEVSMFTPQEPTLSLPHATAQALLQALWDEGLRPDSGEGASAVADALRKHILFAERVALQLLPRNIE